MVVFCSAIIIQCAVTVKIASRSGSNIQHPAKAAAIFRSKTSGEQINRLKNLRADAGRELRLLVIQKRNAIHKFVQRELIAAHVDEVVMALGSARHQVGDKPVGILNHGIGQHIQVLACECLRAAGFFRIDSLIRAAHLDGSLDALFRLQFNGQ